MVYLGACDCEQGCVGVCQPATTEPLLGARGAEAFRPSPQGIHVDHDPGMTGALVPPDPPLSDGVIRLRRFDVGDVDQIADACADPSIQRFLPLPHPYGRLDAEAYIARTVVDWAEGTKAAFAIVGDDDPNELLGAINVAVAGAVGNSGYWIAPAARRRGVATRALTMLTRWAMAELELGVVILEIRPENEASQAVARAAGFHEAGRLDVNTATGKTGGLIFSRIAGTDPASD